MLLNILTCILTQLYSAVKVKIQTLVQRRKMVWKMKYKRFSYNANVYIYH